MLKRRRVKLISNAVFNISTRKLGIPHFKNKELVEIIKIAKVFSFRNIFCVLNATNDNFSEHQLLQFGIIFARSRR